MKKSLIFGAAILALGFVSCSEDNTLGIPQVNPQGPVLDGTGIEVKAEAALEGNSVDLNQYESTGLVPVATLTSQNEAYDNSAYLVMELSSKEDFSNMTELKVTDGTVSVTEWNTYFRKVLGASPKPKTMYARIAAYASVDGQKIRIGSVDNYYLAKTLTVTPLPAEFEIEEHYYITGTVNNGAIDNQYPMVHTDMDIFVDPVFTYTVYINDAQAAAGWSWKAVPQTVLEEGGDGVLGAAGHPEGTTELSGKLVAGSEGGAITINEAGSYLISINLKTMTYSIFKVVSTPGASNGWSQSASSLLTCYDKDKKLYRGFAHLSGEFKLSEAFDWGATNYGDGGDGKLSTAGDAGNLKVDADGLYWVMADLLNLTYTVTPITSLGAIGDMNGWGGQIAMTPSLDYLSWTGDVSFTTSVSWKFRMNDNWDINLGGAQYDLSVGGENLPAPGNGDYEVTLYLGLPYRYFTQAK